jgi:hypothetical protein
VQHAAAEDAVMQEETEAAAAAFPADALQQSTSIVPAGKRVLQHPVPLPKREWAHPLLEVLLVLSLCVYSCASRRCVPANSLSLRTQAVLSSSALHHPEPHLHYRLMPQSIHYKSVTSLTPSSWVPAGAKLDAASANIGAEGHAAASAAVDLPAALPQVLQQLQVRLANMG